MLNLLQHIILVQSCCDPMDCSPSPEVGAARRVSMGLLLQTKAGQFGVGDPMVYGKLERGTMPGPWKREDFTS